MGQERYAREQVAKLRDDLAAEANGEKRFADSGEKTDAIFRTWMAVEMLHPAGPRGDVSKSLTKEMIKALK